MDPTELGISFAPTADQAQQGAYRGGLEGIPQAIKILSLRLPRFFGARTPAPPALLRAPGAQGMDPYLSAVIQTLMRTISGGVPSQAFTPPTPVPFPGMPPTNAGPDQRRIPPGGEPGAGPLYPSEPPMPKTHWQGPGATGSFVPQAPPIRERIMSKDWQNY